MKYFVVKLCYLLTVVKSRRKDNLYCFPFVVLQVLTTLLSAFLRVLASRNAWLIGVFLRCWTAEAIRVTVFFLRKEKWKEPRKRNFPLFNTGSSRLFYAAFFSERENYIGHYMRLISLIRLDSHLTKVYWKI